MKIPWIGFLWTCSWGSNCNPSSYRLTVSDAGGGMACFIPRIIRLYVSQLELSISLSWLPESLDRLNISSQVWMVLSSLLICLLRNLEPRTWEPRYILYPMSLSTTSFLVIMSFINPTIHAHALVYQMHMDRVPSVNQALADRYPLVCILPKDWICHCDTSHLGRPFFYISLAICISALAKYCLSYFHHGLFL